MIDGTNIQQSQLQYQQSVSVESRSRTRIIYHRTVEAGQAVHVIEYLFNQHLKKAYMG